MDGRVQEGKEVDGRERRWMGGFSSGRRLM